MFSGGGDTDNHRDVFQISMYTVEKCFSSHRCRNDHSPLNTIFPLADSNLIEVENQLSVRMMNVIPDRFDRRFEERTGNLESRVLLGNTFRLDKLVRMTGQERIDSSSRDVFAELFDAVVQ
jgi:hypothetical protein